LTQAKAIIDRSTLPADADLVTAYQAFSSSVALLAR
jgi:hypothetical protein